MPDVPSQGTSPSPVSPEQLRARFAGTVAQQVWSAPKTVNPIVANGVDSAIIAVLKKQMQVAAAEKAQILSAKSRRASPNSLATGTGRSNPTNRTSQTTVEVASTREAADAICPPGNQPILKTVDGQKSGVVFAPEVIYTKMAPTNAPSYFYTIVGCHFGEVPGHAALVGPFSKGKIDLTIDTWTDTGAIVHVPAEVSGEFDQDNVTFTLAISGMPLQAPGMKFYAARDEVLLTSMPAKEAGLGGPQLRPQFPFYQSPGFGTFDIQRNASTSFAPGTDLFSFEGLQRGFVANAFQAVRFAPLTIDQCNYMLNYRGMEISFEGTWSAQWQGNQVRIDWPVTHCYTTRGHDPYNEWAAWYGVKVWVTGPRGIDPWGAESRLSQPHIVMPAAKGL